MDRDQNRMELVTDFLERIMSDENEDTKDRLKASELLTKTAEKPTAQEPIEIRVVYTDEE